MIGLLILVVIVVLISCGVWGWPVVAGVLGLSSVHDRESALRHISHLMHTYGIGLTEVETAFATSAAGDGLPPKRSKSDIAKTLFIYLGAIFILAGVCTYIGMFWDRMGSVMRVIVTLGMGYVLLIVLISALHEQKFPKLILPLTFACVFMMTSGWFVLVHEVFPKGDNWRAAVLFVFGVMMLHQGALFLKFQRTVLAFTALFFMYGFMQVGLDLLGVPMAYIAIILGASLFSVGVALQKTPHQSLTEVALLIGACWANSGLFDLIADATSANWAGLIIGLCLMLTGYGLQRSHLYPRLIACGYFFGSILFYCGLFDLVRKTPIELLYFAITASILYLCVQIQSRSLLLTTVFSMLGFIGYFSAEYFADSLGWPITLVLMGVAFLGVGTVAIKVKQQM